MCVCVCVYVCARTRLSDVFLFLVSVSDNLTDAIGIDLY